MGIGLGGVQQLGGGTVIADLIGQDIVAKSISLSQASGSNAVLLQTAGARLKFSSGGTTDYFSGDGSTIITAAGGLGAGVGFQFGGAYVLNGGNGSTGSTDIRGNATNAANSVAFTVGNTTALATAGGQIQAWYRDLFITKVAFLDRLLKALAQPQRQHSLAALSTYKVRRPPTSALARRTSSPIRYLPAR